MYLWSVQDTSFTDLSLMYDSVHEAIHCSYYVIKIDPHDLDSFVVIAAQDLLQR